MYNAQFDLLNKSMQEDKDDAVKKAEPIIPTKIKGRLYEHQVKAYNYALKLFGIGGQRLSEKKSKAVAYLMDMGNRQDYHNHSACRSNERNKCRK